MPESQVRVYQTPVEFARDRGLATRNGWEIVTSEELPDGSLKVWWLHTGRQGWLPPTDFSWTNVLSLVGMGALVFLAGMVVLSAVAMWGFR